MDFIRKIVTRDKNRFTKENFSLDITYITPRVLAMSFPASGLESMYRNPIMKVQQFLEEKHGNKYKILNLSNRDYDYSVFGNQVIHDMGWEDHNCPTVSKLF